MSAAAPTDRDLGAEAQRLKAEASLAATIGETLPLRREGRDLVGLCPFHAERTPSFRVYADHYHCFGCNAHGDIFDWLQKQRGMAFPDAVRHLGGPEQQRPAAFVPPEARPSDAMKRADASRNVETARRIWREAVSPAGSPVERYLASRGLTLPAKAPLRFHPQCSRGDERLPAMIALMTDPVTAEPCGIHRTFLAPGGTGKAEGKAKMMLGTAGVIRLVPDDEVSGGLGIAEGIETGLAVMQRIGWRPVWAACSAGAVAQFPVLPGVEAITLFADMDDTGTGITSARQCAARWTTAGREARVHIPPAGKDWHDAATEAAA